MLRKSALVGLLALTGSLTGCYEGYEGAEVGEEGLYEEGIGAEGVGVGEEEGLYGEGVGVGVGEEEGFGEGIVEE